MVPPEPILLNRISIAMERVANALEKDRNRRLYIPINDINLLCDWIAELEGDNQDMMITRLVVEDWLNWVRSIEDAAKT